MPLAPVPPLAPPPAPPPPPPAGAGNLSILLLSALLLSLLINGILWFGLWRAVKSHSEQIARLETAGAPPAGASAKENTEPGAGRLPRRATIEQRLAALLAVAGDGDRCRRLLDNLSPAECGDIGQALLARPVASDRNGALTAVVGYLAGTQTDQAIALLGGVQEAVLRNSLARQLVETWTAVHPDAAAKWLAGEGMRFLNPTAASAPLVRAITQWSTFDPEGATKFVAVQPLDRGPVSRSLNLASRAWGETNPAAALAWVGSLPPGDSRASSALQGVWEGWTEGNPDQAALSLRQQLYAGANRPPVELAGVVGRQWAQADPAAAAQWAQTLPANGARSAALYQVATVWAQTDAPQAARWAASLPGGDTRSRIWREIVNDWADNDPIAAGAWLGGLPLGRDHDEAVGAYLPKVEPSEPEKALAWAGTVSDPNTRAEQVQEVLSRWARRDSTAARSWAAANAVPILPARALGP